MCVYSTMCTVFCAPHHYCTCLVLAHIVINQKALLALVCPAICTHVGKRGQGRREILTMSETHTEVPFLGNFPTCFFSGTEHALP